MQKQIQELLARSPGEVILMDGGMGTTVEDRGVNTQTHLWGSFAFLTEEGRAITAGIHRDFAAAGAEVVIANMHNTTLEACKDFLVEHEYVDLPCENTAESLHRYLIHAAMECADRIMAPVVAGCVGSVEGPYAKESKVTADEAQRLLEAEIEARGAEGCEFILFETLTTLQEIQGVARAVRGQGFGCFGIGLTCGDDGRTLAGVSMAEAIEQFSGFEPTAYFIQCTRYDLVERPLKELASVPVTGVYANDGRSWENMCWHGDRVSPQAYGEEAVKWRDAGARIIGGCCGTRPEHIRYLKNLFAKES